jgi:[protein-PII] uridylyltransferase
VRALAQHDPYHRFTVDGHSFLAVAALASAVETDPEALRRTTEAGDLRTLRLGTLLHDVGKGSGEDHAVAGERLAHAVATRMGLTAGEIEEVTQLVRWHLLLPDTATRRDLDDDAVIEAVASAVGSARTLRLLYVLAVADGIATGPEAWGPWKAGLVRELLHKVLPVLEEGPVVTRSDVGQRAAEVVAYEPGLAATAEDTLATLPSSYLGATSVSEMADDIRLLLKPPRAGELRMRVDAGGHEAGAVITICVPDRPGTLARTAGVLALHRLSVIKAQAYSTSTGIALERFVVENSADWSALENDLTAAYSGRLAVEPRLQKKVSEYEKTALPPPEIRVIDDASSHSTVLEVRARDALGLLYAITAAMSDLDLDIHVAKIDTLARRVVDVFYVRTAWGDKLLPEQIVEVERSIAHRVQRLFGVAETT